MASAKNISRLTYRHAALAGATICSLLALAYTTAFILYALLRSAFTVVNTVNQDAGIIETLVATWASLIVASLVIGILATFVVAILGAFTGILVQGIAGMVNKQNAPQRASLIGIGVCLAIIVLLHLALRSVMNFSLPDLFSMHALFWLEFPGLIFIVVGGIASRRLMSG